MHRGFVTLLLAASCLLALSTSSWARSLDIHVSGGPGVGNQVIVKVFDSSGIAHLAKTITVCQNYHYDIPTDLPVYIKIYINNVLMWLPLYGAWNHTPGDIAVDLPLPDATGFCGDGGISGGESCDVKGNVGCNPVSNRPVCLADCTGCGCGSDANCVQMSPSIGPCGFGRCGPLERPHWRTSCLRGSCVNHYTCVGDPTCAESSCDPGTETQQACSPGCAAPASRCYYEQPAGCWPCLPTDLVPNPCLTPDQTDCQLDPALLGTACLEGTQGDVADLRSQFELDGVTEDEWIALLAVQDQFCETACLRFASRDELTWAENAAYSGWNVYRGSLTELRATEIYTQPVGSNPLAGQFCGLLLPPLYDPIEPDAGEAAFFLVTSESEGEEGWLGAHSGGWLRPNSLPCP